MIDSESLEPNNMREYWARMRADLTERIGTSTKLDENSKNMVQQAVENIHLNVGLPSWITDEKQLDEAYAKLEISSDSPSFYDNALAIMKFDDVIDARTLHASQASNLLSTHGSTDGEMQADLGYGALIEYYNQQSLPSTLVGSLGVRLGDLLTFPVRLGSEASSGLREADRQIWELCTGDALRNAIRPEWKKFYPDEFDVRRVGPHSQTRRRVEYFSQTLMGVDTAWRLYKKLEKDAGLRAKLKLPGLNYTPQQLFFITAAQMSCYGQPTNDTLTDNYVYTKLKTNAMMSLIPEFSEAFQCSTKTRMNQNEKCDIWGY